MGIESLITLNLYTWHDFLKLKKKPKNQARFFSNVDSGPDFLIRSESFEKRGALLYEKPAGKM